MSDSKQLLIDVKAPTFSTTAIDGESVNLSNYRGKRVWLAFFRHVHCPFCHMRFGEMIQHADELRTPKLQILAVFQSEEKKFEGSTLREKIWFPLISDPEQKLYELYGLNTSLRGFMSVQNVVALQRAYKQGLLSLSALKIDGPATRIPADFLIGADGVIVDAFYGNTVSESIPMHRVLEFVSRPAR